MVSIEDLKRLYWFSTLSNRMLEKISPHVQSHYFQDNDIVFEEGERADNFYMLKLGKILLEVELSADIIISLGAVRTGFSFGWSALLPEPSHYTSYARCVEPCEVFSILGRKFIEIIDEDHTMGYMVMQGLVRILKNRLERRTQQFLKVMSHHPDIRTLLEL
jgi:CRP-like cAMP-binding protein